jgi:hypothetical protein
MSADHLPEGPQEDRMALFWGETSDTANYDVTVLEVPLLSVMRDCRLVSVDLDTILDCDELACRKTDGVFKKTSDRLGHRRDTVGKTGQHTEQLLSARTPQGIIFMLGMDDTASCPSRREPTVEQLAKVMRVHHFRAVGTELLNKPNEGPKIPLALSRESPAGNAVRPEEICQGAIVVHGIQGARIATVREPDR